jgi:2,3-bisphosphoglycerate-dependent phosphoglycerate mutase
MKRVRFLRHAESAANAGLPTSEPGEIPLTEAGRRAANVAAADYEGPPPDLIVVSPFRRAKETAAPFRTRFATALVEEWKVQEFTYLSLERFGESTVEARRPFVEAYWRTATPETNDGPGAESFQDFIARVRTSLENLRGRSERSILVVCHELVIKAAIWLETRKPDFNSATAPQRFREFSLTFTIPNLGSWDLPLSAAGAGT